MQRGRQRVAQRTEAAAPVCRRGHQPRQHPDRLRGADLIVRSMRSAPARERQNRMMNKPGQVEAGKIVQQRKRQTGFLGDAEKAIEGGAKVEQDR